MIHDLSTQKGRNEYVKSLETQNPTKEVKTETKNSLKNCPKKVWKQ